MGNSVSTLHGGALTAVIVTAIDAGIVFGLFSYLCCSIRREQEANQDKRRKVLLSGLFALALTVAFAILSVNLIAVQVPPVHNGDVIISILTLIVGVTILLITALGLREEGSNAWSVSSFTLAVIAATYQLIAMILILNGIKIVESYSGIAQFCQVLITLLPLVKIVYERIYKRVEPVRVAEDLERSNIPFERYAEIEAQMQTTPVVQTTPVDTFWRRVLGRFAPAAAVEMSSIRKVDED